MSPEDKIKKDNVIGLFKNPTTRPILFFTAAIVLGTIGLSVLRMGQADEDVPSSASVGHVASAEHRPGVNASAEHTRLQQEANRRALEEAKNKGQSSLPSLTGDSSVDEPLTLPEDPTPVTPPAVDNSTQIQLPQLPVPTQPVVNPTTPTPSVDLVQTPPSANPGNDALNQQILGYLNMWGPKNKMYQEFVYAGKAPVVSPTNQANVATAVSNTAQTDAPQETSIRYVRAGTMIPAMLITPLNSDAPGPVVAQITSGPLQGARLLGDMKVNEESLLVSFSQISKPGWPDVYSVSAIGMDLKSSTALASDVNHHYLQKYIGILAGSYMQGYGQGMQQQDTTTILDPNGNVIQSQGELNASQIGKKAQGNVLTNIGSDVLGMTKRDPTVKVQGEQGQPYPIKVLFLGNF